MSPRMMYGIVAAAALVVILTLGTTFWIFKDKVGNAVVAQINSLLGNDPQAGSLSVVATLDRADATYAIGEPLSLTVKASDDAYITVFNVGASGKVTQLFPNTAQPDNKVKGGVPIVIPDPASGAQIRISGPVGAEVLRVIATSHPVPVVPNDQLIADASIFRSVSGGVEGLNRDLDMVSAKPPAGLKTALSSLGVTTIAARPQPAPAPAASMPAPTMPAPVAPAPVAPSAAAPVVPVPSLATPSLAPAPAPALPAGDAPLVLATDKAVYRLGEPITAMVTSAQPCALLVWGTSSSGASRVLFPTLNGPASQIGARQTVVISGAGTGQTALAATVGTEVLTAACNGKGETLLAQRDLGTGAAVDPAALERDLAAVIARPGAATSLAQVAITVVP